MSQVLRMLIAVSICANALTIAIAQENKTGRYFCVTGYSGGLKYDPRTRTWDSMGFSVEEKDKFILGLSLEKERTEKINGMDVLMHDYKIQITRTDKDRPDRCLPIGSGFGFGENQLVTTYAVDGKLRCNTIFLEYVFSLKTNRFLAAYFQGFIDGDKTGNTPNIKAGTCTKIN